MFRFTSLFIANLALGLSVGSASARCTIANRGTSGDIIIKGTLLLPTGPLHDGQIYVRQGRIASVTDGCVPHTDNTDGATFIDCGTSVISPGFINTHEHIEYSFVDPFPATDERYGARHEWRKGLNKKTMLEAKVVPGTEADATAWGELRHLFSGTTSIVGGYYVPGLARNLDFVSGLEKGLVAPTDVWDVFPLDDSSGILRHGDCDYGSQAVSQETTAKYYRYIAHIGEGVGEEAQNEFRCLSDPDFDTSPRLDGSGVSTDIIAPNLVLVHASALTKADFDLVASRGAKVVWSPRSNIALYGSTLNVTYLLEAGITVSLGTDWLPTGSATISREAVCAATAMSSIYGIDIESRVLWEMMTINAATVAGFERQLGSLEVGKLADIVVWGGPEKDDAYSQAVYAREEDIDLVMRGGEVLIAGEWLSQLSTDHCEKVLFGANEKFVCVERELNTTLSQFASVANEYYPAILPGLPPNEPTCIYTP